MRVVCLLRRLAVLATPLRSHRAEKSLRLGSRIRDFSALSGSTFVPLNAAGSMLLRRQTTFFVALSLLFSVILLIASCKHNENSEKEKVEEKPPIMVTARVDKESIHIGDLIRYTIMVDAQDDYQITFPRFGENLGGFGIKDFGRSPEKKEKGRTIQEQWYLLDIYTTGDYTIPPAFIKYRGPDQVEDEIETREITIKVESVFTEGKEPVDIRDIKPPLELAVNYARYVLLSSLGVFLVGGLSCATVIIKNRRQKRELTAPPRPPDEIAYEQLERLISLNLIQQGRIKEYYITLSDLVRHYLENRFTIRAPEMTTEEFLVVAQDSNKLTPDHKKLLADFLFHCDMVKFARYGPRQNEIEFAHNAARRLIDETKEESEDAFS